MIPLSKPHFTGKETEYLQHAFKLQLSGNGMFTKKCHQYFQDHFGFPKTFLTTSCTDALEMAAILLGINEGDEVILPSFTFVSSANAFILRGAKVVFADSLPNHPNIDTGKIEHLITPNTKAIVVVHYAGVAVDMDAVMAISAKYNLFVVEDAAQAINAFYKGKPLGGIGHFGCFSFHDTKNITSGEGGMLVVNDRRFIARAEIIWEKGTNRSAFIRGEVDKYGWVDIGSSFLCSELTAAFLFAQLQGLDAIQNRRNEAWMNYFNAFRNFKALHGIVVPAIPEYASHNSHIFYLVCTAAGQRDFLINSLRKKEIQASFHYPPLHLSKFHLQSHRPELLENASFFFERLVRLPLYTDLSYGDQQYVIEQVSTALAQYIPAET